MACYPIYGETTVQIQKYECVLKFAYWHDADEFTILRGSYINSTGELIPATFIDIISQCNYNQILESIHETLKEAA